MEKLDALAAARRARASRGLMAKSTAGTVTTKPGANTLSLYNASHITHKRAGKLRFPALLIKKYQRNKLLYNLQSNAIMLLKNN